MLVESSVSHTSVEDAQDALAGLKNIPGFVFGYVVPGNPKTRLVFLCHCADGVLVRGQKVVDGHATKEGANLETLRAALLPFAEMDRVNGDLNEVACQRGAASDLTILQALIFDVLPLSFEKQHPRTSTSTASSSNAPEQISNSMLHTKRKHTWHNSSNPMAPKESR